MGMIYRQLLMSLFLIGFIARPSSATKFNGTRTLCVPSAYADTCTCGDKCRCERGFLFNLSASICARPRPTRFAHMRQMFQGNPIALPGDANQFPSTPERVSPACLAQIDATLEEQFQDGINYDPVARSWWFEGIPTEVVRYDIRGDGIDLVRVRLLADGRPQAVWVTAGIQLMTGEFHTWGPWGNASEAFEGLPLGQARVRVDVGEAQGAYVDAGGVVDFSGCDSLMCRYADWSEISSNYLSHRFITSNGSMAPGWYPWGYLVWRMIPQGRVNSCSRAPHPLDEINIHDILIR